MWYAFYDLQPQNGADPILTSPEATGGHNHNHKSSQSIKIKSIEILIATFTTQCPLE